MKEAIKEIIKEIILLWNEQEILKQGQEKVWK